MVSCFFWSKASRLSETFLSWRESKPPCMTNATGTAAESEASMGASVIGGEHIIDAQRGRSVLEFDLAGDADTAGAHGALGGVDGAEDGHLEQEGRKQCIVDHLHLVVLDALFRRGRGSDETGTIGGRLPSSPATAVLRS